MQSKNSLNSLLDLLRKNSTASFIGVGLLVFVLIQALLLITIDGAPLLNDYVRDIIFWGAAISMVALGLNLIYGFNGQFSLGQYGFYAIGSYTAADVTYRWTHEDPSAVIVVLFGSLLTGLAYFGISQFLRRFYRVNTLTYFLFYLLATVLSFWFSIAILVPFLGPTVWQLLNVLPDAVTQQIVFFIALLGGGAIAGIISYLFGTPVLELGSDYFGISTLGFTIIVKVLLDNTDTLLGLPEMKGARGMVGIPKWTTWAWVFFSLMLVLVVMRNLLKSSVGRAILSVKEDERAARLVGIDVAGAKILTFVVGSVFAGLAGGLRAHSMAFLHPQSFNFVQSFNPLIIVVFGGLGSMTGTVITGFLWIILLEGVLRSFLPPDYETWRFVVYPLILLVMMLLRPEGLFGQYEIPFLRRTPPPLRTKSASEEVAS